LAKIEGGVNTKTLVVGQDVYVVSDDGQSFKQGKVTAVTPEGVEVLTTFDHVDPLSQENYDVDQLLRVVPMRFDSEGKNGTDGHDGQDVYGFGPWHIDDVPFAERKATASSAR
jgi:hypothetical protein